MDRRGFLKTSGAAAVAAGTASAARAEASDAVQGEAAPAILSGIRRLNLASSWGGDLPGSGAERLAHRIETATGGRYRIVLAKDATSADLTYGDARALAKSHPAFAYFAGLPFGQGLDAASHDAWLAVGGGQMLWDDLAATFGFKPLVAGHTGASAGVWSSVRLETRSDIAGARLQVSGLAADVARALGATPVEVASHELKAALADGRITAAEWLGSLAAVSPDLEPLAGRLYRPGFHPAGTLLSIAVARPVWDGLGAADQAIFEACATQEYQLSLADVRAHAWLTAQLERPAKWPVRETLPAELSAELEAAAGDVIAQVAATDHAARRIHDSYQAFRRVVGEPATS